MSVVVGGIPTAQEEKPERKKERKAQSRMCAQHGHPPTHTHPHAHARTLAHASTQAHLHRRPTHGQPTPHTQKRRRTHLVDREMSGIMRSQICHDGLFSSHHSNSNRLTFVCNTLSKFQFQIVSSLLSRPVTVHAAALEVVRQHEPKQGH
jgi:hypothetical protein